MVQPVQTRLSATQYYQLPEYKQHNLIELINGEVVIGIPPIPKHQRIVREILYFLTTMARQKGGEALSSPIEVYLDEHNIYEPDVLYLVLDSGCDVGDKRLTGAPDLVVEVLSPSTAKYDRQQKFQAYQLYSVPEYWIVDPVHEVIEVWVLEGERLNLMGAYDEKDTFKSHILDENVQVKPIFNAGKNES